jgi:hypothetical protein
MSMRRSSNEPKEANNAIQFTMDVKSEFEKLSPIEQSAASLGVHPDSFKPIAFLNNAHYQQLINANLLDDDLARRIQVFV